MTGSSSLLGIASLSTVTVALAFTLQPLSADLGEVAVGGGSNAKQFVVSDPAGAARDSITPTLSGRDAADFVLEQGGCNNWPAQNQCSLYVYFYPKSKGVKVAQLDVRDRKGRTVSASLKGTGVAPVCTNNVVFCNYAFLYSGNFDWTTASETVKVQVVNGVATCNGSATLQGRPKGIVSGTGLVAVEFVRGTIPDSAGKEGPERLVYRVTVACPSPAVPATSDGAALPSRPAELGDFFQQTYNQPVDAVAPRTLVGSISTPVEGEGTVSVSWSLMRK